MTTDVPGLDLLPGWQCSIELKQNAEGAYFGKAELRQGSEVRCVFVLARQASREAVFARLKVRAHYFIQEWEARAATSQS